MNWSVANVAEVLNSIVAKLNSNASLDEILEYVVERTSQILGSKAGAIYRLNESTRMLRIQTAVGLPKAFVDGVRIPLGQAVVGQVVALGQPMTLTNIRYITEQVTLNDDLLSLYKMLENNYRSVLAVPIVLKESAYGGFAFYFADERAFHADEIEIATILGDHVALVIENFRVRKEAEKTTALAERNRLAHDLHDSVSQILFAASLIAEVLPAIWEIDQTEGLKRLHELRQLTRGAVAEMHTLLRTLRPAALEETPLPELLRHLVEATIGRARIPIELVVTGQIELPPQTRVALYRIAQQALDNIFRHAKASQAEVSLQAWPDFVELRIEDNGRGFDPSEVPPGRLGMKIMRERAEAVHALLDVQSTVGGGTRITVRYIMNGGEVPDD
jgi:signal transduction histidine kinase